MKYYKFLTKKLTYIFLTPLWPKWTQTKTNEGRDILNYTILNGDCLQILKTIPDNSIECCVTSPPYYGLRDYGCEGQIGLETTPEEYIGKLVDVFREVYRVLKEDGVLWLNVGDSYAGNSKGIKRKELLGIPWRVAFALRQEGWYLRQDIIWHKPNAMPESVKDRCTKSHEYLFLMSKSERYYFDQEAIKEPCVSNDKSSPRGSRGTFTPNSGRRNATVSDVNSNALYDKGMRNRRSVWNIPTQGYRGAHFATFPEKLAEPCVLSGTKRGGTVIDPFSGSATTGVVAIRNDRNYIGIEINPEYVKLSIDRLESEKGRIQKKKMTAGVEK